MAGTVIPMNKDTYSALLENWEEIKGVLTEEQKIQIEQYKAIEEGNVQAEKQARAEKKLQDILHPPKEIAMQKKLAKVYDKYITKGNFFPMLGKGLKSMAQGAGSFFGKFIKLLLMLSLLGPEFADAFINLFVSLIEMIAGFIIPWIPRIVKTFIHLLTTTIPAAIERLLRGILPALGAAINESLKGTKLAWLGEKIQEWFGPNGALTNFFVGIGKFLPMFAGAMWILSKLIGPFKILGAIFGFLGTAIFKIISFLNPEWIAKIGAKSLGGIVLNLLKTFGSFIIRLLPQFLVKGVGFLASTLFRVLTGPVGIIVTVLQVLYTFAEEIQGFFNNIAVIVPQWLEEKFGIVGKIIGTIFKIAIAPIRLIIGLMVILKKYVKDAGGWLKIFSNLINIIKAKVFPVIIAAFNNLPIVILFKKIFGFLGPILSKIWDVMKPVRDVIDSIWKLIKKSLLPVFDSLKWAFNFFTNIIAGILKNPTTAVMNMGKIVKNASTGATLGNIADMAEREGKTQYAQNVRAEQAAVERNIGDAWDETYMNKRMKEAGLGSVQNVNLIQTQMKERMKAERG